MKRDNVVLVEGRVCMQFPPHSAGAPLAKSNSNRQQLFAPRTMFVGRRQARACGFLSVRAQRLCILGLLVKGFGLCSLLDVDLVNARMKAVTRLHTAKAQVSHGASAMLEKDVLRLQRWRTGEADLGGGFRAR